MAAAKPRQQPFNRSRTGNKAPWCGGQMRRVCISPSWPWPSAQTAVGLAPGWARLTSFFHRAQHQEIQSWGGVRVLGFLSLCIGGRLAVHFVMRSRQRWLAGERHIVSRLPRHKDSRLSVGPISSSSHQRRKIGRGLGAWTTTMNSFGPPASLPARLRTASRQTGAEEWAAHAMRFD